MKKITRIIFLFVLVLFSPLFFQTKSINAQSCYPHNSVGQCESTRPCCDFPIWQCINSPPRGNVCTDQGTDQICGREPGPCCQPPNYPCGPGLHCDGGYCKNDSIPTSTPRPTIGPSVTPIPECLRRSCDSSHPCCPAWVCNGGYCKPPSEVTPTQNPSPTPSCGMPFKNCCSQEPKCVSPYGGSVMICQGGSCLPQTTSCGLLSQPCCPPPDQPCRVSRTACEQGYCRGFTPTPDPGTKLDPSCTTTKGERGVFTALGCIAVDNLSGFASDILGKLIFVASGIAFLLMAFGAIQILTSAGSPEKMKAGSELITSALSGLIFIILSVFLLKLIGVDILQLPGF